MEVEMAIKSRSLSFPALFSSRRMDHFLITGQLQGEFIFRDMCRQFISYLFAMFTPMDDGAHGDHLSALTTSGNEENYLDEAGYST
jgi:hypothetical protein